MTWQTSYYHYDGLGSTLCLTDENGEITDSYAYTAFGEELGTGAPNPTPNPFRWLGQSGYYRDADTEDYYVRARVYRSMLARWLSQDPLHLIGLVAVYTGLQDYRTRHYDSDLGRLIGRYPSDDDASPYRYVHGDPLTSADPSGFGVFKCVCQRGIAVGPQGPGGGGWAGSVYTHVTGSGPDAKNACSAACAALAGRWEYHSTTALTAREKALAAICAKLPTATGCAGCTQARCEKYVAKLIHAFNKTSVFLIWPGYCQRWLDEFERRLSLDNERGGTCVKEGIVTHFTLWRYFGLTRGHAAYRVTFCDGSVVYFDDGAFGGIFRSDDIPGDATEDFPPK